MRLEKIGRRGRGDVTVEFLFPTSAAASSFITPYVECIVCRFTKEEEKRETGKSCSRMVYEGREREARVVHERYEKILRRVWRVEKETCNIGK